MSIHPELLKKFEKQFQEIRDGKRPKPGLQGYTRLVRQVQNVEVAVTHLAKVMAPRAKFQLPMSPETGYDIWVKSFEDDELSSIFGDIFAANPNAFGSN